MTAGIPMEKIAGSNTSVFSGCFSKDYFEAQARDPEQVTNSTAGNGTAMLNASVVTGADILLNPDSFISMSTLGALSKDGRCFAWDSRANGFGRGEGVAVMIIKPLETALRDGDRVHGVIRGIGLNQDGKTPTISSPSMEAQVKLIHETYKRAGLDIADTGYVEAHMTGTAAGDPIEAEALAQTFGKSRAADDPIYVGSVKTNVGHAEPVSGLAAIIKTCFALREGLIPRNLNYEVPHKNIPLKDWHLQVPTELMKWPVNKSLRASINNFGYGGTNAHVILEGAPAAPKPTNGTTNGIPNGTTNRHATDESRVYLLSARDATVAKAMANDFATHFPTKAVNTTLKPVQRLGFVFNGQGAQWYAMGRELILAYPTFGAQIREASEILSEYGAKWSLIDELMRDEKSTRINEVDISQPSTVAIQLCLVDLLKSWGITPAAVTSHSSGEIAAAYTVGALTFKEALGVIFYRGQLAVKLQKNSSVEGGMAAVGLGADGVEKYTTGLKSDGQVTVACINSSSSVTLSGDLEALDEVVARIDAEGIFVRKLKVPLAYHSHHMALISGEYTKCLTAILPEKAKSWDGILFSSPVTGEIVTSADVLSPSHWARNLTSPVLFSEAFESMCFNSDDSSNVDMILEIGAHSTLAGPIRQLLKARGAELPDHQVESKVIAPGATYIAMAIEATRLLTDPSEETIHHVGWYQFELTSLGPGDLWVENCKGFVTADIGNVVEAATTQWQAPPTEDTYFATKSASKVREITNESLFSRLQEMGIQHGPVFQNLTDSKATEGKGLTNFVIADVASTTHDYVLHPTTLDSIFQASFCCLPEERARSDLVLPRSIRAMYIPQKFKRQGGDKLQAFTELARLNRQGMTSNISVISTDVHEPKQTFFQMQDFFCQAVPRDTDEDMAEEISLCAKNCWVPDILHAIPEAIEKSLKSSINDVEIDEEKKRIRAAVYLIHDAVKELEEESSEDIDNWVWHHKLFYDWMKATVASADRGELREGSKNWTQTTQGMRQYLYDELEGSSPTDQMLVRIGQNLPAILRGEITTLELMMEGNLLNEHYGDQSASALRVLGHARTLLEIHAMKDPGAKILEIGGGTGGGAKVVLEAFDARARQEGFEGSLVGHYTFTDISQGFFAAARERFSAWEGMMDFKQLDIDEDPTTQGFEEGQYDMIIAGMVLHATKNLHRTLTHVRKLLKPGGKLILLESTKDRLDTQLIFGPLPGWWLAEEADRKMSPNASVEKWDEVLRETGFGGVDFDIFDYEEPEFQSTSTILATAMPIEGLQGPISIVHDASQDPSHPWFKHLCATIEAETGVSPVVECLDVVEVEDKICIVTAELQQPFLDGIDGPSFESLRGLLVNSKGVLWLSSGGLVDSAVPSFAATQGLLRTLRLEDSSKRYVQLDFETASDANEAWSKDKFGHIVHVLQQDFNFSLDKARMETEYSVKDSMLHVSRLIPDKKRNQIASTRDIDPEAELQPYYQTDRPLVWETSGSGMLSDLHFVDKLDLVGDVPSGFIEVESKAMGLNFRDVLVALGQLDEELIGHESGGIITRVGPDTEHSGLRVGDRVSACPVGRFATRALAHWTAVVKIPDDMSFEHAAAVPVTYGTAYHALFHVARIQKGETVLIHAAAGGFGQAAVVLAQYAGAEVFATCSSEYKRDIIHQQYNVPLDHILSSREPSFAPAIMAMTNGQGVDIVLNSLSGAMLKETWDCVARFGRFIEVGKVDLEAARRLDMSPFRRCTTFASVDLMQLREYNRPKTHEALVEGVRISYERGKAPILPITQYSMSDMEKAMRLMQSGKHTGKLLFVPSQEDKVKVISRVRPVSLSDPNATYLIVGGLTGIGYAVAEFLMSKGANHLLLVSRKATKHENAAKLHAQGAEYGCKIHIRDCDLTSESSLVALLKECSSSMPPIRGLINCAMVLDDTVFEHMKYEQWTNGIRSKIDTSRNLDKYLPKDISFFIMLASGLGVAGGSSQGNYAAGNAYQDALSRKRIKQGLASTTLDLCVIRKVGYVENRIAGGDDTIVSRFLKLGFGAVDVAVVLQLIESAIRDPRQSAQEDAQIVMGISEATCIAAANNGIPDRRYNALQMANRRGRDSGAGSASSGASPTAALLAEIFSLDLAEIDVALPLSRYGVDSLVAVELRNWLSGAIRAKVTVFEILQSTSLTEFAGLLAVKSEYVSAAAQEVVAEGAATEEVAK
ncbi:putative Phthiocerol synthesis polyketide synthase type I PpsA [Glarea lozoyensis 74030]|uniref:Putative Phthiocerol synthesis polyketide synthase type I PpsA n=1 Tax=Glarea lozoyensis (strain ATCC 74030 / MF5533) TaxID=1104152 RepID=H0EW64_GLAL7|nr:putative Phthiocerol synthesis polyketide synthase type I PpsA [Glarea lozoyensis 74030]